MAYIKHTVTGQVEVSDLLRFAMQLGSIESISAVAAGGAGYSVGDILTLSGGISQNIGGVVLAQVEVVTVVSGAVTEVRMVSGGIYNTLPPQPAAVSGGSGTGCQLSHVGTASNGWTEERNELTEGNYNGATNALGDNRHVVMVGEGNGASDQIYVGWRTFSNFSQGVHSLEVHGMSGHSAVLDFMDQPNLSPGDYTERGQSLGSGAYVPVSNALVECFINVNAQRVVAVFRVGGLYFSTYMGFLNRFGTSTEYPYPLYVAGCASSPDASATLTATVAGLNIPRQGFIGGASGNTGGPGYVFFVDNSWYDVYNTSGPTTGTDERVMLPAGSLDSALDTLTNTTANQCWRNYQRLREIYDYDGTPTRTLFPTPATVDKYVLTPNMIAFDGNDPSGAIVGELDGVFTVIASGGMITEDQIVDGGESYRVFQNGANVLVTYYFAIKES